MLGCQVGLAQVSKGPMVYSNALAQADSLSTWVMEGPAELTFADGWMRMHAPQQTGHHVMWCPQEFPANFVAEWEVKNNNTEAGLCIVFFSAKGLKGQHITGKALKPRNGTFKQYTKGDMRNYHISYYANTPAEKSRPFAHLRKNPGFKKVHVGKAGIPAGSTEVHLIQLLKNNGLIQLRINNQLVIDWQDDGTSFGAVLEEGYIGFRQMKWTDFSYRDFRVWKLN